MGIIGFIDAELQKDLLAFIKAQEEKPYPHVLGDAILVDILKNIVNGETRISGCATNHETKRMYLEISFYEKDGEQSKEETT